MDKFTRLIQVGLLSLFVFSSSMLYAVDESVTAVRTVEIQNVPINGVVKDLQGAPIIGATVVVKGTSVGSTTGVDGDFSFSASVGAVVEVNFLGYKQKSFTVTRGQSVYNVILEEDALKADEVIVTALGIKRNQKAIGYAVSEIKGEDIAAVNVASPVAAIQGKAAGVSIRQSQSGGVMGSPQINIRGMSTINGHNQPIFVVDGVILENNTGVTSDTNNSNWDSGSDYGNQLKNLNADDFESMTILKGAAATALYGSRGINGAVVITTKSGKANKNFGVSVSQVTGIDVLYRSPSFQNVYGQGYYPGDATYTNRADGSSNRWDNTTPYFEKDASGKYVPSLRNFKKGMESNGFGARVSDVRKYNNGKIIDYDGELVDYELYPNNLLDAYNTGVNTSTNVSISGGGEKTTFYLSDTYQYRKGTYEGNNFERNSTLLKGSYQISSKLRVDASINYTTSRGSNPVKDIASNFWDNISRDYNVSKYRELWTTDHGGAPNSNYGDKYGSVPAMSKWYDMYTRNDTRSENVITPIIKLNYEITNWLSLNAEANMNYYSTKSESRVQGDGYQMEGGSYSLGFSESIQKSAKAALNFNKKFGDFSTSLIAGGEWYRQRDASLSSWTKDGLIVPGQYFLANSKNPIESSGGVSNFKNIYSVYFLASVSWKDQLFLDVTGRNDWSSSLVFANGQGNFSYFYPSVSGSWLFTESFSMPDWFTYGKLRASWAQVGNDTSPYFINNKYDVGSVQLPGGMGYENKYSHRLVDPNLKPERKNSVEVGVDLRFINNRIGLDFTYYKENTKNQIVELPASSESDVTSQLVNAGNIQNQGFEIALNTTPIKKKNFEWNLNFIYTRNRNKIISLHPDMGLFTNIGVSDSYGSGGLKNVAYVGGYYGEVLTTNLPKTNEKGEKVLVWNDGYRGAYYARSGKEVSVGNITPDFEASMYNNFKFYGVEIGFLIDARMGGYFAAWSSRYIHRSGFGETSLRNRGKEYGGIEFASKYSDAKDVKFDDGMIPEGVFSDGQVVTTPTGASQNVSGLSYREAYDKGYIEPTHASYFNYRTGSWSTGWVDDSWCQPNAKFIALRNVSIGYTLPAKAVKKLKISNLHISLDGHNVCYLYNNLPNKINPESSGSSAKATESSSLTPYSATYSLAIRFNL